VYLTTIGGSGLLHLLAAYPRVIGTLGLAATVTLLLSPSGQGRQLGTAGSLAQLDRSIAARTAAVPSSRDHAEAAAAAMLERANDREITTAVREVLEHCGTGCTDLTSAAVIGDVTLLRRVLVLQQLDTAAEAAAAARNGAIRPEGKISSAN
jgi:hypothetical protein